MPLSTMDPLLPRSQKPCALPRFQGITPLPSCHPVPNGPTTVAAEPGPPTPAAGLAAVSKPHSMAPKAGAARVRARPIESVSDLIILFRLLFKFIEIGNIKFVLIPHRRRYTSHL